MVDPTAWADVKTPSLKNTAATGLIDAYTKGQQQSLYGSAIRKRKKEQKQEAELDNYREEAVFNWRAGDRTAMMNTISNMARISPDDANELKDSLAGLDTTNAFNAAMHLYNAYLSDDPDAITTSLARAKDSLDVGLDHPLSIGVTEMQNLPAASDKQRDAIYAGILTADKMGLYPQKKGAQGDPYAAEKMDIRRQQLALDIRAQQYKELHQREERDRLREKEEHALAENMFQRNQWSSEVYKDYKDTSSERVKANAQFRQFQRLANEFAIAKKNGVRGGILRWANMKARDILGLQDPNSNLYRAWNYIRASEVIQNLPSGPASDKDIAFVSEGALDKYSKPEAIEQAVRGMSKLAQINDIYYSEKLKWMDRPGSGGQGARGFASYWKENGERLIKEAGVKFEPRIEEKPEEPEEPEEPIDVTTTEIPKTMDQRDANTMIREAAQARGWDPLKIPMAVTPGGRVVYEHGDAWYYIDDDVFYTTVR